MVGGRGVSLFAPLFRSGYRFFEARQRRAATARAAPQRRLRHAQTCSLMPSGGAESWVARGARRRRQPSAAVFRLALAQPLLRPPPGAPTLQLPASARAKRADHNAPQTQPGPGSRGRPAAGRRGQTLLTQAACSFRLGCVGGWRAAGQSWAPHECGTGERQTRRRGKRGVPGGTGRRGVSRKEKKGGKCPQKIFFLLSTAKNGCLPADTIDLCRPPTPTLKG